MYICDPLLWRVFAPTHSPLPPFLNHLTPSPPHLLSRPPPTLRLAFCERVNRSLLFQPRMAD